MDQNLFKMGLMQFSIFLLISILTLTVIFWFIRLFISKKHQIEDFNTAYGIVSGGIIFSVFYLISALITPIISTLKLLDRTLDSWTYVLESAKHISILMLVAIVSALLMYFVVINIVKRFYKDLKLFEEIKNNHIGLSILIAIVLISFSLLLRDSLQLISDSFVPYPEMPNLLN